MNKEDILLLTDKGLAVFKYYIPFSFKLGRNFLNPLYKDSKASCNVYFDRRNGMYKMKDFGNDDYSGDCFALVGKLNGLNCKEPKDFVQILAIIDRDMHLGLSDKSEMRISSTTSVPVIAEVTHVPKRKKARPYTLAQKSFTAAELAFWGESGITQEVLKLFRVVSLKKFSSENNEGKPFSIVATDKEPVFGYTAKQYVKVYRPHSEMRFLYAGDFGENYCFGLEQLPAKGDLLFITGGEKDVMSLTVHGFHAICFNSETVTIPVGIIHRLSFRFKHIVLLYDVDKAGLDSSAKQELALKNYGVKRLLLPLAGTKVEKDISDFFRLGNSREDLIKLFLDYLDTIYSETMSALKSCEVDFNNPPPVAQMVVSVNDVPLGTQGNILCITGGEGTGKSNYVTALIAGAIGQSDKNKDKVMDTLGVSVCENSKRKAILFYDTEQSEVQTYKNITNLLRRCGRETMPEYLKAYCLTGMSRKERLQAIIQSMDKFHYQFRGIHMVVIDGIADLIKGANDETESIAVVEELYRLAGIYNTCIVTILHFIPSGLKLRGHLGSELQRKAAAILSIEKDTDPSVSVVKALKVRDGSPLDVPIMQFAWDKDAGMHVYLGEKPKEEKEKRKEDELVAVARDIFGRQDFITYVDLAEQIQAILDVKERTAKSYIKFMREKEIIRKDPSNQSYYIIGNLKQAGL
ncbi:toprim domain-containing protein [Bacteroides uniformis]|uniref:Toprim domain-containing protein n=2 Tax=Bacteroides TaxID=816 RepID=A0A6I0LMB7_BACUN|nr:toprim domain-containing protein [Bacteroides uniformis]KAB4248825.1 toprim domain-containing protein [Bacteroides uniformis]KAB4251047.1 toprim domain-containing protein [Bacteroides uniformis]KAB4254957.1 toprim domain-containing protein [Bacteroides uniformis]KAB4258788.1 toprim domain-containing protein [Bacteroides uniformis]